jgi:GSH-dependent disulfide-bond oxidoreductase
MIDLYYWPTPNGHKISIALEEMGLAYTVKPVNILRSEQFASDFLALNPNHKIPTILDHDGPDAKPYAVIESGAILQYLAEKCALAGDARWQPTDLAQRYRILQWLTFQVASMGPMFGQCGHFLGYAPEKVPYAIERYHKETKRLYGVLNTVLEASDFLAGDYSIADIAAYPWCAPKIRDLHQIDINAYPAVKAWTDRCEARLAVQRGMAVLGEVMKIGNPDEAARQSLFGATKV